MEPERVPASVVREKVMNESALLVCAYEDDDKYSQFRLDGAISMSEFRSRSGSLDKDTELYFYCA